MPPEYSGRLELTWTNKHRRLLAHEDGTYEWVEPGDHRVAEIRLLKEAGVVAADEEAQQSAGENLLIRGDALAALTSLTKLPEYAAKYRGKVKLVYIDPPFNTGQAFPQYDDNLEHSVWLTMIRDRLLQIRDLLAPDGSVWVHLDDTEQHRARAVLDEVFGMDNFVAHFIWQKLYARKSNSQVSTNHDHLLCYRRSSLFQLSQLPPSPEQLARYKNRDDDPRGPWQSVSFHVRTDDPQRRTEYRYKITLPSGRSVGPPRGRHWNGKRERFERMLADNVLWFGKDGDSAPRVKQFLSIDTIGLVPFTIWPRDEVGDNDEAKGEVMALNPDIADVFQTPKPERLLHRVLHLASGAGDIVLDCFVGSGTTAAVAHKMGRRWVGVEWSEDTLAKFAIPRLTKVVRGEDPGGITETAEWDGGGGFQILDVGPTMFLDEEGIVYLADWAANEALAEPVAAQLGFKYQPDEPPFCGRKGRTRLAVIDGMVTPEVIDLLADRLADGETLALAATSIHPDAEDRLKERVKGYALRKVPESILAEYASTYRRRRQKELGIMPTATGDND